VQNIRTTRVFGQFARFPAVFTVCEMPQRRSGPSGMILITRDAQDGLEQARHKEDAPMNSSETYTSDRSYPYVLICSLSGTIVSLAAVWLSTVLTYGSMIA
jgi:hypothetical protein